MSPAATALRLAAVVAVAVLALAAVGVGRVRGDAPLTTADVVKFLRNGISEHVILAELKERGFSETLDLDRETRLREAGASETLVVALRRAGPASTAMTTAEVVKLLGAGITERTVMSELKERGFAEAFDSERETRLRHAGASETLIAAVRRAAAAPSAPTAGSAAGQASAPSSRATPRPAAAEPTFPSAPRVHGPTFSTSTKTVRVPVSVVDKRGEPVMGLREEDFSISEDGKKQDVTFFSGERRPLRIALALDISASMEEKIREVEDALRHFIDLLEPDDEILVLVFNDRVDMVQDFTADRDRLYKVLNMLQPAGATALFDAAREAIERVAPGPAESKAVVLVTDGVDTVSQTSWGELREIARRSEVPVFSIGLDSDFTFRSMIGNRPPLGIPGGRPRGPGRGGWPGGGWPGPGGGGYPSGPMPGQSSSRSDFDAGPLLDLADETGAHAEILKGLEHDRGPVDRLKDAVESIAMTLRHRYLVGYEPVAGKKGWRKIKVDVDKPQATAHARKGYYAES